MKQFFKLSLGLLSTAVLFQRCYNKDLPSTICENSTLAIATVGTNPVDCDSKGSIDINASEGKGPYLYSLDGGAFLADNSFSDLVAGSHIARVKDANGCIVSDDVLLTIPTSTLVIANVAHDEDSGCKTSNGELAVAATGGVEPYSYSKDNVDFSNSTGVFTNLSAGTYAIFVKDDEGCITSDNNVKVLSGTSYINDIKPILEANCIKSGCHNGDNGTERNWSVLANVQAKASKIKQFTADGTMPLDIAPTGLPQNERDLIACWVNDGALNN
jgi:hypothetical protein